MPILQVDGIAIAEIDQETAEGLLEAAKLTIGKGRDAASFQRQIYANQLRPSGASIVIDLTLDFLVSD
jgi:hypothetical protein